MPDVIQKTEAEAVAALVKANNTAVHYAERKGVVVLPSGQKINLDDERFDSLPKRPRAKVSLYEAASFIAYLNAHKLSNVTHVFGKATEAGGSFTAIIDYHTTALGGTAGAPGWGEHSASLTLETTPEWRRWVEGNNRYMPQETFAEFLEDNMSDIVEPDAGSLIDMAQMLSGKKSVNFRSGKNLKNGAIAFEYTETIEATGGAAPGRVNGDMSIPDKFTLGIVPFVGANGIRLEARLRFRISDQGKLTFAYILNRPFEVIEQAFNLARKDIEDATKLPVHLGTAQVIVPAVIS